MENLDYYETGYEIINGKIVSMSPRPSTRHSTVLINLSSIFRNYFKGKLCKPFAEVDVFFDDNNHFIPDLVVVCDNSKDKGSHIEGAPDLAVEILSPSTTKYDKYDKKDIYEKYGVMEYWIVDVKNRSIEVFVLDNQKYKVKDIHAIFPDYEIYKIKSDLRDEYKNKYEEYIKSLSFRSSLFEDLVVHLDDVFSDLAEY